MTSGGGVAGNSSTSTGTMSASNSSTTSAAKSSNSSPTANSGNAPVRLSSTNHDSEKVKDFTFSGDGHSKGNGTETVLSATSVDTIAAVGSPQPSSGRRRGTGTTKKKIGDGGGNKSLHKSINSTVTLSDDEDENGVHFGIEDENSFENTNNDDTSGSAANQSASKTVKKCYSNSILQVLPPEDGLGPVEYKRQIAEPTPKRLRTLATQMAFRIDEGRGTARYEVGVEDDGRHSMLDKETIVQSVNVLEAMARTLNALVIEKIYYQNEEQTNNDDHHEPLKVIIMTTTQSLNDASASTSNKVVVVGTEQQKELNDDEEKKELSEDESSTAIATTSLDSLMPNKPTRCTMTIQRIETHLLEVSPPSLTDIANAARRQQQPANNGVPTKVEEKKNNHHDKKKATSTKASSLRQKLLVGGKVKDKTAIGDAQSDASSATRGKHLTSILSSTCSGAKIAPVANTNNGSSKTTTSSQSHSHRPPHSISDTMSKRNIRVAVVGNVDAGKSTLIGTLTTSCLDDGRGRSRSTIVKHRHEIETGRTSTATTHLMGFRSTGETISDQKDSVRAPHRSILKPEDEVARESFKVVTLMDLAGHEKYLKTTIHGVSSGFADYALILVNARHPPTHMTQHHINLCCSFGIPLVIVFTKVDGCPDHAMKTSKQELQRLLRSGDVHRRPFMIKGPKDVETCTDKMHSLAPMIETSCVTGKGLDLLKQLLFWLPRRRLHERKLDRAFEFLVEDIFHAVPGVAGSVVSGFVNAGELTLGPKGTEVFVGPTDDGTFLKTVAKSAHIARINTNHVTAGQNACLALALHKEMRKKLRRGMVVVLDPNAISTKEFEAEICVLKGDCTTIRERYQAYVHILNVRQSAFAKNIELVKSNEDTAVIPTSHRLHHMEDEDDDEGRGAIVLRPGSRAKVRFEFAQRPEYIRPGMRMLFRDGRVRGVGIITGIPVV